MTVVYPSVSFQAVVTTNAGKVRGVQHDGIAAFLGIPYGADTAGHRFQPPIRRAPWSGVRDCCTFGPQAPQGRLNVNGMQVGANADPEYTRTVSAIFRPAAPTQLPESEDCLVLNVYTPQAATATATATATGRPVMVWLHGGGFSMGSAGNRQYDGSALCRRGDVVVVTVNHRLSALGYLYLGAYRDDLADSGNVGQLDILLALQWVHENIAAFGGDCRNVTVFGESGGGAKVSALLAMPATQGLIHKAVIQSGPSARMMERDHAVEIADRTLHALGIARSDAGQLLTIDRAVLIAAASSAQRPSNGIVEGALAPVVDGRSLPAHPFHPRASSLMQKIPLLIGTCRDEWTLMTVLESNFGTMSAAQAQARFVRALGDEGGRAFEFYRSLMPDSSPTYWVTDMMTDMMMRAETIEMAERRAAAGGEPVFMYRLDWQSPVLDGALRSPHSLDVPLVFETLDEASQLVGESPAARRVSATMAQAWTNFARTGNPSQQTLAWPPYENSRRLTMIFDDNSTIRSDPDAERRQYWTGRRRGAPG
jgi:para-nitrobenzyl esterase